MTMIARRSLRLRSHFCLLALLAGSAVAAVAQTQFLVVTTALDDAGAASHCKPQTGPGSGGDAACSLRDALAFAAASTNPSISITFDSTAFSSTHSNAENTITLTAGRLSVPSNTSISGPTAGSGAAQANLVTVSGNNASTVFFVGAGAAAVQISALNIVQGAAVQGGGIVNAGALVINNCTISGNVASSATSGAATGGGGILNSGQLTVNGTTIAANSARARGAAANGGGIENSGNLKLVNSTVSGNSVTAAGLGAGGGIFTTNAPGSSLELSAGTVSANTADGVGGGIYTSRSNSVVDPSQDRTLQTLGDSITYGYASTGCPAPYQTPTTLADSMCWAGLVAYNLGYALSDTGVSDSGAGDVSAIQIYNSPRVHGSDNGQFVPSATSIATFLTGEVDDDVVPGETLNYFNGTRQVTEWQMEHEDVTAFMLTPNKKAANSSACSASAGWFPSTLWTTGGLQTTTSGATITCPIVGSTAYVSVMAQVGNASSISISIDGGPATTYPYALSSASRGLDNPTSGELFRIPNLQPVIAGTPAATAPHTVRVTANVSGTNPVFLNWVDGNGNEARDGAGPVVFALSLYQSAIRTDANGALPRFRSLLAQEAADMQSDGLNEIMGDLSIPCTQLPVSDPPVSLCDTFDGTHPTDSGEAIIANYMEQLIQNDVAFGNSIVSGNAAPLGADTNDLYIDNGGNLIGASGIALAPLANHGGPTPTMPPLPGSPALCAGATANSSGLKTDQRGLSRLTVYGSATCIDAGAVETSYALAFSTQPPAMANLNMPVVPAAIVQLKESGQAASAATSAVSMTDGQGLLTGTTDANLSSGAATFGDLVLRSASTDDTLVAKLTLTPALSLKAQSTVFQVAPATLATMISPVAGTAFTSSSIAFSWTAAPNGTGYYLLIGSTGIGSDNIYNSAQKTVTSYTFNGMPTNGEKIYVRLTTNFNGIWLSNDYTYTAAMPAVMTTPVPGAVLAGSTVAFTWSQAVGATGYYLWVGSTGVGSNNIYNSAEKTVTSYTMTSMPTNSEPIYVRLITNFSGVWAWKDYTYTAAKQAALILSPAQGATLGGKSVAFTWSAPAGATGYYLWIGSTGVGSNDLYNSEEKTVTSYTFPYMPTNGETVYVRLNTNYSGTWVHSDYTYTATAIAAQLTSPTEGSALKGPAATFTWPAAAGASGYFLWIGSTGVGSNNIYNSQQKIVTTFTFNSMPTNGETIYVRLITNYSRNWVWNDYTYTAATQAVLTSPAPGGAFAGSSVTFGWTAASGATGYYLWIGNTGVGSNNIYNSAEKTVTSYTFPYMPTNGETIYVRLNTNYSGTWVHNDYTYTAAP
jgi:hypothetical protein